MVKSKFPGKPSKFVQRTLVNAFSVAVPSCDTTTITENVCYGLSVFENTFGDEDDDLDFVGFTDQELEASREKREKFIANVAQKFNAHGLTYTSSLNKKQNIVLHKIIEEERHNFKTLNKNSLLRFKHKPLSSNYLCEKYRRKFNLPSRSLHSSRVIKPNKRFIDTEKNKKKAVKFKNEDDMNNLNGGGDEKAKFEVSSIKVIIREARLNISTETGITGPFSVKKSIPSNNSNSKEVTRKENSTEIEHFVARGPRIKHVCRSASSVLRTSAGSDIDDSPTETNKLLLRNGCADTKGEKQSQLNRIRQCGENDLTIADSQNESELSQYQGARSLQDFGKESSDESEEHEDKLISTDFWEAYDPDEVCKTGFPLISSEAMNVRALCFLCGSAGIEKLLYCVACCEPYHWYCAEGPSAFREEAELEKCRANWVCRKCKICSTCGKGGDLKQLSSCKRCRNSYHIECLSNKATNKRLFKSDRPWVCPSCLKCKSCNSNTVFTHVGNIALCSQCFKLRQKGNYCPLCQGCYQDEDYIVQMMECGMCKCWIHAKCEGISYEKYQILSFLPDSVEFVCRLCCSVPPALWWLAVEDELKAGFYGVLKSLCNNKKIGDLLKESPRKEITCGCHQINSDSPCPLTDIEQKLKSPLAHVKRALNYDLDISQTEITFKPPSVADEATVTPSEMCSSSTCNLKIRNVVSERLLAIKAKVRSNQYASVFVFHQELENVLTELEGCDSISKYREILKQFFPWFDPEHVQHEDVLDNSMEAIVNENSCSAKCSEKDPGEDDDYSELRKLINKDEYKYEKFKMVDVRRCNLCKGMGEAIASEGGRLIYCGRNEWVHSNCALWSSEVFEEIDGSLQNVHSAISRGRQIRCSLCDKKGASVGCCFKNCTLTFHFPCAKKSNCVFLQNKTIYCNNHDLKENNLQLLVLEKDFEILRPVYIEMDRKKKKLECHANVKLRIGSLHVESLGKIDPHLSDNAKYILPIYFRCTRLFWSTTKPWKIVQYHIQIKVRYSYQDESDRDINYTVDHSVDHERSQVVKEVLDKLVHDVCEARPPRMKRKLDFHTSPPSKKKSRENGFLSAAKLNHVVVDYHPPFEKLIQLDGMIDIYSEEEPVTCVQCQRTYRTTFSYERHLDTCNTDFGDFMISSCESDSVSSEEDKLSCSANYKIESSPINEVTYIIENNEKFPDVAANVELNSVMYPCSTITYEDAQRLCPNTVNLQSVLQSLKQDTVNVAPQQPVAMPFNILDGHGKITTCDTNYTTQFTAPASYNVTTTPTYLIQPQYQKAAEVMPTFVAVDNPTQPLQFQHLPQPSMNYQQMVPTILGTVVQPNIIEAAPTTTYIVNTSTATDLYSPQNVILQSQPMIFGMETVVSNTVMSSSHQFVAQSLSGANIGSSTLYSTTTTQVFQAAKQLPQQPNLSSGFIVLNTPVSQQPPLQPLQPAEQVQLMEPQLAVVSNSPNKYMYVHVNNNVSAGQAKKLPQVIVKPVKQSLPAKKNIKVMKLKNNRPIAIQTADNVISLASVDKNEVPAEGKLIGPTLNVKNLKIKTTEKAVLCRENVQTKSEEKPLPPLVNGMMVKAVEAIQEPAAKSASPKNVTSTPKIIPASIFSLQRPSINLKRVIEKKSPPAILNGSIKPNIDLSRYEKKLTPALPDVSTDSPPKFSINFIKVDEKKETAPNDDSVSLPTPVVEIPKNEEKPALLNVTAVVDETKEPVLNGRKLVGLDDVAQVSETSCSSMPLLDEISLAKPLPEAKPPAVSETEKIFDELLRQHKLSLAKEKATKSTAGNLKCKEAARTLPHETSSTPPKKAKGSPDKENEKSENKAWKTASISYEVNAEDGFTYKTNDLHDLWNKILESVQHSRNEYKLPLLPKNALVNAGSVYGLLGFENNASKYLLEQLPDAWKCIFYKPVFHKSAVYGKTSPAENVSGCARTEPFTSSHKFDMFGWLASRHRKPPKFMMVSDSDIVNGNRRITSLNLPMAMRFRHLKETAKETVGVFRSDIHGRGLFCLRDIDAGEMVIEYAGEVIRSTLTDKRERYYTSKGIGCYMFRIDDRYVVDATMCGNAARFINHSCDPNCYSRIVDILGKKHILIFALRRIPKGEELTYDYKFPLEEDKIHCHCLARKCRKYLN